MLKVKFLTKIALCALALAAGAAVSQARAESPPSSASAAFQPVLFADATSAPVPVLAARSWLLVDLTTGQKLAGRDADMRVEPASLTKLMVDYLTLAAIREKKLTLTQAVPIPVDIYKRVNQRQESVMFIPPGKTATVDDLLHGLIIQSGNDAALVLATAVGGSETSFVEMMNREARRMGMTNTNFRNPAGLSDPQHYTTATDLAILVKNLIADFPDFYPIYSQKEFTYNGIKQANRNRLLWADPTVDGVKTGHTEAAGYCLIASAKRPQPMVAGGGERRLLSVMLGTVSADVRAQESLKLLNWGFQNFDAVKLFAANQAVDSPEVWKGTVPQVKLGFQRPVYLTLPRGQSARIKPVLDRKNPIVAPIAAGQQLGTLKLLVDEKLVATLPVVALESVDGAGIMGRAWDSMRLMFR